MADESIELMAEAIALFNAKDWERLSELYNPDAVVRSPQGWPEPGPFVGRDAIFQQFQHLHDAFDDAALEVVGGMRASRDRGQILHQEYFWDHAEALEAAALER